MPSFKAIWRSAPPVAGIYIIDVMRDCAGGRPAWAGEGRIRKESSLFQFRGAGGSWLTRPSRSSTFGMTRDRAEPICPPCRIPQGDGSRDRIWPLKPSQVGW